MTWETKKLREYLLGNLPEDEKEALELEIFTDQELIESLLIVEDEIMEDYLDQLLSQEEQKAFDSYFLNSTERLEKLKFLGSLKTFVKKNSQSNEAQFAARPSFYVLLKNFYSESFYPAFALSAGAVIVLCAAGYLLFSSVFLENTYYPAQSEISRLNQNDAGSLPDHSDLSRLSLMRGTLRDENSLKSLSKETLTETVLLRLALPPGEAADDFQIKIMRAGNSLALLPRIPSISSQGGRELRLLLPASELSPGVYQIDVQPASGTEKDTVSYFFSVR